MRRNAFFAILSAILLFAAAGPALAAGVQSGGPVEMQGQATVDQSQRLPRLLLSADATDGSGYHLDATLSPATQQNQGRQSRQRGGESEGEGEQSSGTIGLIGRFTLSGSGFAPVTGQASGQLGNNGLGALQLSDPSGSFQMQTTFSVDGSGGLQLELSGQLPSSAQSPTSTAGATAASTSTNQPVDHTFWYVARAAGLSAYLLLFLNVVLGLAVHTRFVDALMARWRSLDLHQFTALLAMAFLALHGLSLLGDHYIGFTWGQLLVPFASSYRPGWVATGIVGFYLLAVVTASSYLRRFVSYKAWRALHYLSFAAYILALVHGIYSGTDSGELWARALYWSTGSAVALLMLRRFQTPANRVAGREAPRVGDRHPSGGIS